MTHPRQTGGGVPTLAHLMGERRPGVLPWPTAHHMAEPHEVFEALQHLADRWRRGHRAHGATLFRGLALVPDPGPYLPTPFDPDLAQWHERVRWQLGGESMGLQVSGFTSLHPAIAARTERALGVIREAIGPIGPAELDLFHGDYVHSPFGLHKDAQDVVTFVVQGEKAMRVWPFEAFAGACGDRPARRDEARNLWQHDPSGAAHPGTRFQIARGVVLYFPRECWHVAEPTDAVVTTLALGLLP